MGAAGSCQDCQPPGTAFSLRRARSREGQAHHLTCADVGPMTDYMSRLGMRWELDIPSTHPAVTLRQLIIAQCQRWRQRCEAHCPVRSSFMFDWMSSSAATS
jgi:hypothetical protein